MNEAFKLYICQTVNHAPPFYHGCNILTNQIAQKEVDKSLISNLQDIYQPNKLFIGCQLSNFPNSCVASLLLQEELSFLYLARERSLQQMTRTMLIYLYVRFWEP